MRHKAVFWDMDGTLVDSEPLHHAALEAALRELGIEPPANLQERAIGIAAGPLYEMLREEQGLSLPFEEWILHKYGHYMPLVADLVPRPGALEIYGELRGRGVHQAVVSNSDRLVVDANLRAVGLSHPGMRSISRNDVISPKPAAEPFLRAAYLAGVDPAEAVAVDDSWTGVTAGLAAGMRTIFWPERPMEGPAGAIVVNSAEQLRYELGL